MYLLHCPIHKFAPGTQLSFSFVCSTCFIYIFYYIIKAINYTHSTPPLRCLQGPGRHGNQELNIHELIGTSQEEGKAEKMVRMYSEGNELQLETVDQHGCTLMHHSAKVHVL